MATRKVVKELGVTFNQGDNVNVIKKKVNEVIAILDSGGNVVTGLTVKYMGGVRRPVPSTPAPPVRRQRQQRPPRQQKAVSPAPAGETALDDFPGSSGT
ncbi:MAG TPA: hypothetical protein PLH45_08140 [Synergistales bacterium]|nr:hypothetical protein [Synergistales bacterium]